LATPLAGGRAGEELAAVAGGVVLVVDGAAVGVGQADQPVALVVFVAGGAPGVDDLLDLPGGGVAGLDRGAVLVGAQDLPVEAVVLVAGPGAVEGSVQAEVAVGVVFEALGLALGQGAAGGPAQGIVGPAGDPALGVGLGELVAGLVVAVFGAPALFVDGGAAPPESVLFGGGAVDIGVTDFDQRSARS